LIDKFKEEMKIVFEMTDLGKITFFLGMQIFLCQYNYAKEIQHGMVQACCNSNKLKGKVLQGRWS